MYTIKTRNWNCNKTVQKILSLIVGNKNAFNEIDGDGKYQIHTKNPLKAWAVWAVFMAIRRLSGGWTYIIRPGHCLGDGYKAIY